MDGQLAYQFVLERFSFRPHFIEFGLAVLFSIFKDEPQSMDNGQWRVQWWSVSLLGEVPLYLGLELLDFLVSQVNEFIDFVNLIGQLLLHGN